MKNPPTKLFIVGSVQCPECGRILEDAWNGQRSILVHPNTSWCKYSGQKFRAPTIALEKTTLDADEG